MNLPPLSAPPSHRWRLSDFLFVWLAGLVTSLIGTVIGIALGVGGSIAELEVPPELLFWVVLPTQFFGMLLALAWVSQRRGSGKFTTDFGFSIRLQDAGFILVGMLLLLALAFALQPFAELLGADETPQFTTEAIAGTADVATRILIVLGVAVVTPIVEELTFRGLLLRYLEERVTPRRALLISAAIFGLFHLLGTTGAAGAVLDVQTFLAGLVLAYVTQKSGKLSRAIFIHGGFNLVTIMILFFFPDLGV
ncbi:MAG: type II CAAX endopeptidase family protein [Acidimicrobiia bacterium]|nr:type II CAAX endopeptidase family protein [Acidimicrobiia bacterium]